MMCPQCGSNRIIKNGSIQTGTQKYLCKDCHRQFVEHPTNKVITQDTWNLVEKLLLEKIPLAGIARVTGLSERWLQTLRQCQIQGYLARSERLPAGKGAFNDRM